ncbi:hypothetical protein [Aureliella helgolandensis]|uniref:RedB protein n=1 Tax=Aureliella helgolandensis TaxID=2527968 RepID=A0A518G3H8_9BACT|nr:hypothetical protein [Aureliella helgolandensis]QDV23157.1 hypothetical protein Q31a_14530 [Aureliella helgolandensis]
MFVVRPRIRDQINFWSLLAIAWGVAAIGVWSWGTRYEFSSHADDSPVPQWPADARLTLAEDRPTLLFFMHPRCVCTRASIRQLEETLTGMGLTDQQQPQLTVVAAIPNETSEAWRDSASVRRIAALPRSEIIWDSGGREASRFGAKTSGAARLYRQDGVLLFAGGITASRGHEGDNLGCDRLRALLCNQVKMPQPSIPVFGCRLCATNEVKAFNATDDDIVRPPHWQWSAVGASP